MINQHNIPEISAIKLHEILTQVLFSPDSDVAKIEADLNKALGINNLKIAVSFFSLTDDSQLDETGFIESSYVHGAYVKFSRQIAITFVALIEKTSVSSYTPSVEEEEEISMIVSAIPIGVVPDIFEKTTKSLDFIVSQQ